MGTESESCDLCGGSGHAVRINNQYFVVCPKCGGNGVARPVSCDTEMWELVRRVREDQSALQAASKPESDAVLDMAIEREVCDPAQVRVWLRELRVRRRMVSAFEEKTAGWRGDVVRLSREVRDRDLRIAELKRIWEWNAAGDAALVVDQSRWIEDLTNKVKEKDDEILKLSAQVAALQAHARAFKQEETVARILELEEAVRSIRDRAKDVLAWAWGRNPFEGGDDGGKPGAEVLVREASSLIRDLADHIQNACPDSSWWADELAGRVDAWFAQAPENAPKSPDKG